MYLGTRTIRSAGRTSGSIEITLPARLKILSGLPCSVSVRDGPRPEIVLHPDLSRLRGLYEALWEKLRLGLADVNEIGEFSTALFTFTLFPTPHWEERPPLTYADALAFLEERATDSNSGSEALARLLAALAAAAGRSLNLGGAFAVAFGDAVAYLLTGTPAGFGADFERGMAHRVFWEGASRPPLGSPFDDRTWCEARSGLKRVFEQFRAWEVDADAYAHARRSWYRALRVEMSSYPAPLGNVAR